MMHTRSSRPTELQRIDDAIAWSGSGLKTSLRLGSTLRMFGMRAVVDTQARDEAQATAWWRTVGAVNLIHCPNDSAVSWTARGRRARRLPPEQVAARLAGGIA